jgi:hypothetical protein
LAAVTLFGIGTPTERASEVAPDAPAAASPSPLVASGNGLVLQSVNVQLPSSDRSFPGGARAEAITNNCTPCHSAGMILEQPALTPTQWLAEIRHMRVDFKAPVTDAAVPAIAAYLDGIKVAQ